MAQTTYTYSILNHTATGDVALDQLQDEIIVSSITTTVDRIDTEDDVMSVVFADALSSGDQTTLDSVVSLHEPTSIEEGVEVVAAIKTAAGSATEPTYAFSDEPNTGLYLSGAGVMTFVSSGTETIHAGDTVTELNCPLTLGSYPATRDDGNTAKALYVTALGDLMFGDIDHDSLLNFVTNEHIDHSTVSIVAGDGLTGGGTIASTLTLNVVGVNSIVSNANDIQFVNDAASPGNNKVYGTDGAGVKGWKDDPAGGGSVTFTDKWTLLGNPPNTVTWLVKTVTGAPANTLIEITIDNPGNGGTISGVRAVGATVDRLPRVPGKGSITMTVKTNALSQIEWRTASSSTDFYYSGVFA